MGFDDFDGVELFVLNVPQDLSLRRRNYSPVGTKSIDVDLRTRTRREEFLLGLKEFGCVEHASEWLEERMRGPVFMAKAMYFGSDYVGSMLVTGTQADVRRWRWSAWSRSGAAAAWPARWWTRRWCS